MYTIVRFLCMRLCFHWRPQWPGWRQSHWCCRLPPLFSCCSCHRHLLSRHTTDLHRHSVSTSDNVTEASLRHTCDFIEFTKQGISIGEVWSNDPVLEIRFITLCNIQFRIWTEIYCFSDYFVECILKCNWFWEWRHWECGMGWRQFTGWHGVGRAQFDS